MELAPAYWGHYGYAIEVALALVDFGFGELGLREIYGNTVSGNDRIARVAMSLGAVAVTRPAPAWMAVRGWSQLEWRIKKHQWESSRPTSGVRRAFRRWQAGG
jgi:RimJ/RimL family protein N-acetyltransferase